MRKDKETCLLTDKKYQVNLQIYKGAEEKRERWKEVWWTKKQSEKRMKM